MTVTSCQKVPLATLSVYMMNKSCFNYTKIKHDCKLEIVGHLSTREKKEKKEKDIVRVNSIQIESIDKLRDFCPPERKQPLPDLLIGRNAAYISVLGDFCIG
jgi:hypothetical protein